MNESAAIKEISATDCDVDDAVGLPNAQWFVAIVNHNAEKGIAAKLDKLGIISYLPLQTEHRVWKNGRKVKIDRVVIPSVIFIRCTEQERRRIVEFPFINRFMINKARNVNGMPTHPLATIPDTQIEKLKFMTGNSDNPVYFYNTPYIKGDRVRVVRGRLSGLEGEVRSIDDKHSEIIVNLDSLGNARLTIETINVEKIKP